MIRAMVKRIREVFIYLFLALFCKANGVTSSWRGSLRHDHEDESYCLSWRLAVEVNNMRAWRTVPTQCREYIETYMIRGQYYHDLDFIINQISSYADEIAISGDGMDAWILDVDDTCISNIIYYQGKRYGYVIFSFPFILFYFLLILVCIFLSLYNIGFTPSKYVEIYIVSCGHF
jgi:hypothetical protein